MEATGLGTDALAHEVNELRKEVLLMRGEILNLLKQLGDTLQQRDVADATIKFLCSTMEGLRDQLQSATCLEEKQIDTLKMMDVMMQVLQHQLAQQKRIAQYLRLQSQSDLPPVEDQCSFDCTLDSLMGKSNTKDQEETERTQTPAHSACKKLISLRRPASPAESRGDPADDIVQIAIGKGCSKRQAIAGVRFAERKRNRRAS